ncbi:MAG TPA: flavin reductase family protein [Acidimicrobiales bacterium]|jgi:flavin reductase (DIM6/NTAB) family NADH-FMN oxidoreductase RutF|nr:flavin reductase family protein [Acidimicrobiales bacterium]
MTSPGTAQGLTDAIDTPLYVVTAEADGERSGCLAGFVTQASIQPVRFLICISKVNHTFGVAEKAHHLALHALGSDQHDVATLFGAQTGDDTDKFSQVQWSRGVGGSPVLASCAAWVEGTILNRMSAGDHEAFLVSVDDGGPGPAAGCLMLSAAADIEAGHPVSAADQGPP